jgi:hypothetical protein
MLLESDAANLIRAIQPREQIHVGIITVWRPDEREEYWLGPASRPFKGVERAARALAYWVNGQQYPPDTTR